MSLSSPATASTAAFTCSARPTHFRQGTYPAIGLMAIGISWELGGRPRRRPLMPVSWRWSIRRRASGRVMRIMSCTRWPRRVARVARRARPWPLLRTLLPAFSTTWSRATTQGRAWATGTGYDLATGLGSVNAANLVNNCASVSFNHTTSALTNLSPTTVTHGLPVSFTINVAPGSGSGTPTGDVSLIAQAGNSSSNSTGIGSFTLSNGSFSGTTNMLPGGKYGVTAHYAGNGTYGASDSTPPVQVTVSPEGSQTHVALLTFDPTTGKETNPNATSI